MTNIINSSISNVHRLLLQGSINSIQLCDLSLEQISKTSKLNAFISYSDNAKKNAELSCQRYSQGKPLSIIDGIPFAVKDNFCTIHFKTTCASKMLEKYYPPFNATVVDNLINNGGLLMGKTNLDDFAIGCATMHSAFGPCRNPWRINELKSDWYVPGGSSGGSAVAVAVGSVFAALGSDTGGSTRNPAAHTGIVGFKPSYGALSRFGLLPLANSMDNVGIMARYVEDVEYLFEILKGPDVNDLTSVESKYFNNKENKEINKLTIGLPKEYLLPGMSNDIINSLENVANLLSSLGANIISVSLPHTKYVTSTYAVINCSEVASNFACFDGLQYGFRSKDDTLNFESYLKSTRDVLGEVVKDRIFAGNYFLLEENNNIYLKALRLRRLILEDFNKVFKNVDLLLTPVTSSEAKLHSEWIKLENETHNDKEKSITREKSKALEEDSLTQGANLAGLPAISIPVGLSSNKLPLGIQCIGNRYEDKKVLMLAKVIEGLIKWKGLNLDELLNLELLE